MKGLRDRIAKIFTHTYVMYLRMFIGAMGFVTMPIISYLLFEYVTGNIANISSTNAILNIAFNFCLYLVLLGVTANTRIAIPASSLILFVLSLAQTFVMDFRSRPIMPWDIMSFGTAMTVSENYSYEFTSAMHESAQILLVLNLFFLFFPFRLRGVKRRLGLFGGCASFICGFIFIFYTTIVPGQMLMINYWDITQTYESYGYILSSAVAMNYVVKKAPSGYSHAKLEKLYEEISSGALLANDVDSNALVTSDDTATIYTEGNDSTNTPSSEDKVQPVNIICIMNESFSDLSVAGEFTTDIDYMPFYRSLTENTIKGSLVVPVYGSMTSNTEYEFLTGDTISLLTLNSNPYQFNVNDGALTLVSTLKTQGYRAIAMHPYPAENWNRDKVYAHMGFDEFYDIEYYDGCEEIRNYVSDLADYEKIIEQVESKSSPDEKLFVFNVTMQNHGGYAYDYENFTQDVWLTGDHAELYPETDRYLSLIKKSDEAIEYLIDYFSEYDEPTMIVIFGDHEPAVENEFYDNIYDVPSDEVPTEDRIMWYETPFMIWTNYEQTENNVGELGSVYLSSYVLEAARLQMPAYNKYLLSLSKKIPIIHPNGCYDRDGNFYAWDDVSSSPYATEILNYQYMAYNHSLDSKVYTRLFSIE